MKYSSIRYFARMCYQHALTRGKYDYQAPGVICVYRPEFNAVLVSWGEGYRVVDVPKAWASL